MNVFRVSPAEPSFWCGAQIARGNISGVRRRARAVRGGVRGAPAGTPRAKPPGQADAEVLR